MNLLDYIAVAIGSVMFLDLVVNIASMQSRKRMESKLMGEANKKGNEMAQDFTRAISSEFESVKNLINGIDQQMRLAKVRDGISRCYAFLIGNGATTRLFIQAAPSFETMVEIVTREFGLGWTVLSSSFIDVEISHPATEEEKKPKPDQFVTDLLYVRDRYAASPYEKRTMTTIINKIKSEYGQSAA